MKRRIRALCAASIMIFLAALAIGGRRAAADVPIDPGIRVRTLLCASQHGICSWMTAPGIVQLGQPMIVSLYLGNTTSSPIESCVGGLKLHVELFGTKLPSRTPPKGALQAPCLLAPQTPRRFLIRVNDFVNVTEPGNYLVYALLDVLVAPGHTETVVSSAAEITVMPPITPTPSPLPSRPWQAVTTIDDNGFRYPGGAMLYGNLQYGVWLSLTPTRFKASSGAPPEAELWITNTGEKAVDVCPGDFVHSLTFDVVSDRGVQVPLRPLPRADAVQPARCTLSPETQWHFIVALNDFVMIGESGTYLFTAHLRASFPPFGTHTLTSNQIAVEVPEADAWSSATPSPPPVITSGGPDDALSHTWVNVGRVQDGVRLSLTPGNATARLGEPISVSLWARDVTGNVLFTCIAFFGQSLTFDVVDSSGKSLPSRPVPDRVGALLPRCPLNPLVQYRYVFALNDFVRLTRSGKFTVTAHLRVPRPNARWDTLISNPITVQVTP